MKKTMIMIRPKDYDEIDIQTKYNELECNMIRPFINQHDIGDYALYNTDAVFKVTDEQMLLLKLALPEEFTLEAYP